MRLYEIENKMIFEDASVSKNIEIKSRKLSSYNQNQLLFMTTKFIKTNKFIPDKNKFYSMITKLPKKSLAMIVIALSMISSGELNAQQYTQSIQSYVEKMPMAQTTDVQDTNVSPDSKQNLFEPKAWGDYSIKGNVFVINGQVTRVILAGLYLNRDKIRLVELNTTGGHTDVAYAMASIIKEKNMITYVGPNRKCYSACTIIFQAAKQRIAHPDSEFLYHTVSGGLSNGPGLNKEETAKLLRFLQDNGVSDKLINKIQPGHDEIISGAEAYKLGVVTNLNTNMKPLSGTLKFDWSKAPSEEIMKKMEEIYNLNPILGGLL